MQSINLNRDGNSELDLSSITRLFYDKSNCFSNVVFNPYDHSYIIAGKDSISVTSLLKKYVKPFDRDYWAQIKAKGSGLSVTDVLDSWEFSAKLSQIKGTVVHSYLEMYFKQDKFCYPQDLILESMGYDPVQDVFNLIIPMLDKFLVDIGGKMHPIASEFIVGDMEYQLGGTVDQIFYNKKSGNLEIWDWKTNKAIRDSSRFYHLDPIAHIPDCELEHYSLQLSLYKLILEKNTGLKFGDCYIAWFHELNDSYVIYRAKDYVSTVKQLLVHYMAGSAIL